MTATAKPHAQPDAHNPASDLAAALRARTRAVHERLHGHPVLAPLTKNTLNLAQYITALQALERFHQSVEAALAGHPEPMAFSTALTDDLNDLAANDSPLPACSLHLNAQSADAALGVRYVVYGSALGGQLIAKKVARTLGWSDQARGLSHFRGAGRDVGRDWRRFLQRDLGECTDPESCVDAAIATFNGLEAWLWSVHRGHAQKTAAGRA